jgi:hypothetical protein
MALCLTATLLILTVTSGFEAVLAQEQYAVGVKAGDYVKYGNFVVSGPRKGPAEIGWEKVEVLTVSWDNNIPDNIITVLSTGAYKNETAFEGNGTTGRFVITPDVTILFIPANLSQGEDIAARYNVTRTENRTYLGVSRTVNIAEFPRTFNNSTTKDTYVYDRASGMKLEEQSETKDPDGTTISSSSVIETNIFGPSPTPTLSASMAPSPSIPELPTWIVLPILSVGMFLFAAGVRRKKLR